MFYRVDKYASTCPIPVFAMSYVDNENGGRKAEANISATEIISVPFQRGISTGKLIHKILAHFGFGA
jgi:hypothetical protein